MASAPDQRETRGAGLVRDRDAVSDRHPAEHAVGVGLGDGGPQRAVVLAVGHLTHPVTRVGVGYRMREVDEFLLLLLYEPVVNIKGKRVVITVRTDVSGRGTPDRASA